VDLSLIGVPTRPVVANDAASVVAVDKSACRRESAALEKFPSLGAIPVRQP